MRVVLVGPPLERARLREELASAGIDVVGEFPSLGAARRVSVAADALVLTTASARTSGQPIEEPLTARETQVLELLAEGLPNKAIAERLEISDQTVKFHVASIAGKLGATNRTDAVRRAVRMGLIVM